MANQTGVVMFFIFGSRYYWRTISRGTFQCPNCQVPCEYRLRRGRRFIHLFFIPLIPISGASEHVRCSTCKKRYKPSVLAAQGLATPDPATP
jgi:hypothetical protein